MIQAPTFRAVREYGGRLTDVDFWRPYVVEVLDRHGLAEPEPEPVAGFAGTFPAFLCGDVVVKLFGYFGGWSESFEVEHSAQALLATKPRISAPKLVASGRLYDGDADSWPYLVTTRMPGVAWRDARLDDARSEAVAAELGAQVRLLHRVDPALADDAIQLDWADRNRVGVAERHKAWGSLPDQLIGQIDAYLDDLAPFDRVITHADLTADHAFVLDGHLTGIIDWGDMMVTDRHYELGSLHLEMFRCDKRLLAAFLDAAEWQPDPDTALRIALLHRFDVFEGVQTDADSLPRLARDLFEL